MDSLEKKAEGDSGSKNLPENEYSLVDSRGDSLISITRFGYRVFLALGLAIAGAIAMEYNKTMTRLRLEEMRIQKGLIDDRGDVLGGDGEEYFYRVPEGEAYVLIDGVLVEDFVSRCREQYAGEKSEAKPEEKAVEPAYKTPVDKKE